MAAPACLSALFLALAPALAAQGAALLPARGPLRPVQLDLASGRITRGSSPAQRALTIVSDFPNLDLAGFVAIDSGGGALEWFNDGVKGVGGNGSDQMARVTLPYATCKLDPALGGPGGTVKLGFYEGYTRLGGASGPNGTAVAVMTLTGLPGHSASTSFFAGFSSYLLQLDLAELVAFADGPIGYSWKFVDLDTDGVFGATGPFLANTASCTSTVPDALGQLPYTCCSLRPADAYLPGGVLLNIPTFAPYCLPWSVALDIGEVVDVTASAVPFSGDGLNADLLAASPAILGQDWSVQVTLGHTHGALGAVTLRVRRAVLNGPNFVSPLGGRLTEFLVGGPLLATLSVTHNGTSTAPLVVPVPPALALLCQDWAVQGLVSGGGFVDLSSAVFGVSGTR